MSASHWPTHNEQQQLPESRAAWKRRIFGKLWEILTAPATFAVTSIIWCLVLAVGSILAYRRDPRFWVEMDSMPFNQWLEYVAPQQWPDSWWVYALVYLTWLMVLSLAICTVNWFFRKRTKMRGMAEVLVHLGFLLVFGGYVLGAGYGARVQNIRLTGGEAFEVKELGVTVRLESVETKKDEEGNDVDTISRVALLDSSGNTLSEGVVRTNHPLIRGNTVVYPQGAESRITGALLEVEGVGEVEVGPGKRIDLPGGIMMMAVGALEEGKRYGRYVGPGILVRATEPNGKAAGGAYFGSAPGAVTSASVGGVQVRLMELRRKPHGVFHVHRDPGILYVLAGTIILGLGTVWALGVYMIKPAAPSWEQSFESDVTFASEDTQAEAEAGSDTNQEDEERENDA